MRATPENWRWITTDAWTIFDRIAVMDVGLLIIRPEGTDRFTTGPSGLAPSRARDENLPAARTPR